MGDRAQRGSRLPDPSSRRGSRSVRLAAGSRVGPGSAIAPTPGYPTETGLPGAIPPAPTPRATFRHLQQQGLTAGEAASLTEFMCGMPAADLRRSLMQINHVLFQQRLYQLARLGIGEGERIRPH
jgi:hypothetical protein